MSKEKIGQNGSPNNKAVVPTGEDVRAARFYIQVTEEARRAGITSEGHINVSYNTPGHKAYFKRGAAILVRYNLILSPEFKTEEKERIAQLEELYSKVISGPLIRFNKGYGKRGRFAGLALRDTPGNVAEAVTPIQMSDTQRIAALSIFFHASEVGEVPLLAEDILRLWDFHIGGDLGPGVPLPARQSNLDLVVDYRGAARENAIDMLAALGLGLASGVDRIDDHEIYLTQGGQGRVFYLNETGDPNE